MPVPAHEIETLRSAGEYKIAGMLLIAVAYMPLTCPIALNFTETIIACRKFTGVLPTMSAPSFAST